MRAPWLGCVLALAIGCTTALASPPEKPKPIVEKGGEQISRGLIDEGLETLDTVENRDRLGRILNSQEMREAVHDLSESLVLGAIDGVRASMDASLADSFGSAMEDRVTPAAGRLARRVINSTVDAALTDANIGRLEGLGERATQAAVRGLSNGVEQDLGPALAATIDRDIGPALAIVIERDILPAMARGMDTPEMQQALSSLGRSLATEVVIGAGEAITQEDQSKTLTLFGSTVALGYGIALFAAFALGTLSVVLIVLLVRNARRLRKLTTKPAES